MAQSARRPSDVIAAGAVVTRKGGDVILVHRPKYDDWSFPKGKLDPGEHITSAAVREVAEETGLDIRLGPPLSTQRYWVENGERRIKRVYYWVGRVVGLVFRREVPVQRHLGHARFGDDRVHADRAVAVAVEQALRRLQDAVARRRRRIRLSVPLFHHSPSRPGRTAARFDMRQTCL